MLCENNNAIVGGVAHGLKRLTSFEVAYPISKFVSFNSKNNINHIFKKDIFNPYRHCLYIQGGYYQWCFEDYLKIYEERTGVKGIFLIE